MKHSVLFLDDEPSLTAALRRALHREPYHIFTAQTPTQALSLLDEQRIDVLVTDDQMPEMSGSHFVALVKRKYPSTIRMVLTGQPTLEATLRAINQGEVYRFLTKPINQFELALTIRQALVQKDLIGEVKRLLQISKHQFDAIQELEKKHPGLINVGLNTENHIVINDGDHDLESLVMKLRTENEKFRHFLPENQMKE